MAGVDIISFLLQIILPFLVLAPVDFFYFRNCLNLAEMYGYMHPAFGTQLVHFSFPNSLFLYLFFYEQSIIFSPYMFYFKRLDKEYERYNSVSSHTIQNIFWLYKARAGMWNPCPCFIKFLIQSSTHKWFLGIYFLLLSTCFIWFGFSRTFTRNVSPVHGK